MNGAAILFSLFFIGFGIYKLLVDHDVTWEWQQLENRLEGVSSQRTETWERWQRAQGAIFLAIGVLIFLFVLAA